MVEQIFNLILSLVMMQGLAALLVQQTVADALHRCQRASVTERGAIATTGPAQTLPDDADMRRTSVSIQDLTDRNAARSGAFLPRDASPSNSRRHGRALQMAAVVAGHHVAGTPRDISLSSSATDRQNTPLRPRRFTRRTGRNAASTLLTFHSCSPE